MMLRINWRQEMSLFRGHLLASTSAFAQCFMVVSNGFLICILTNSYYLSVVDCKHEEEKK